MFEVSDKASEMIKEFLKNRDVNQAIRILMAGGG
jgi:Fe-S cluster assembly iron-binding protein IscA